MKHKVYYSRNNSYLLYHNIIIYTVLNHLLLHKYNYYYLYNKNLIQKFNIIMFCSLYE